MFSSRFFFGEILNMTQYVMIFLLLGAMARGQAADSRSSPAPQKTAQSLATQAPVAPPGNLGESRVSGAPRASPDAPVITIKGLCDKARADEAAWNCRTAITRAEFEKTVEAVQSDMPLPARRQFAVRYANALVLAQRAHEMGLDQGPAFEEHMKLARIQVLSEELSKAVQEKFSSVSDKDVEDYYRSSAAAYEEADLQRIFIPRVQQLATPKGELSANEDKKRTQESENTMKAEADKLHMRAVAGENFDKLQEEAFQLAGIKMGSPNTTLRKVVRGSLPPSQVSAMDLKSGEVSPVLSDPSGYFIYKAGAKDIKALDEVRDEIRETLRGQRMQDAMRAIQQSASPTLDDRYFGGEDAR
jgi:hypothetical protein